MHSLIQNLFIEDQQANLNYLHGNLIQYSVERKLVIKNMSLKGVIKN